VDLDSLDDYIQFGNSAALDWYAITHDKPLPSQSLSERLFGMDFGPISPQVGLTARGITGGQILFVVALAAGAYYLLKK
jgi:hypothetical protein